MTQKKDISLAISLGVDAIGLIFYSESARCVSISQAKSLVQDLPPFITVVAVMVNPKARDVIEIINTLPIQCLQFHGDESPTFCAQFHKPYIKSLAADKTQTIQEGMELYTEACAILLDTPSLKRGGTGQAFDWNIIPVKRNKPIILAGGLVASNVAQAVSITKPYAVDVCSGIEKLPGIKDADRMIALVDALRGGRL